ncbi:MAG: hypothetical protein JSR15_10260 [Proteobacteria bacterium]|nr:hypothetical protein [Pseudomonadota bacterium]
MARWGAMLAAAVLAAGCGRGADQTRAEHEARLQARAGADRSAGAAAAASAAEADFVAAVSAAPVSAPVSLKFRMQQPPQVGVPLQLELLLSQEPQLEINSLLVSLVPGDNLSVLSNRSFEYHAPRPGATQRMTATLRADAPGVLSLSVNVLVDSANASVSRYFNIPVIAVPAGS